MRATSALIVIGMNAKDTGMGTRIANAATRGGGLETFRWLESRGLEEVNFVVSDGHEGVVDELHHCLNGEIWHRFQTYFRRNVADKTPAALKEAIERGLDCILKPAARPRAGPHVRRWPKSCRGRPAGALECLTRSRCDI